MKTPRKPRYRKGYRVAVTATIDADRLAVLDGVADARQASRNALIREAIDFFLAGNRDESPSGTPSIKPEPANVA